MLDLTKDQRTIMHQRETIDELEETVRQLREELAAKDDSVQSLISFPTEWGLSLTHQSILSVIYEAPAGGISHEQILSRVRCPRAADPLATLRVQLSGVRKRLKRVGVEVRIAAKWGGGYWMTPASKVIIKEALERRTAS